MQGHLLPPPAEFIPIIEKAGLARAVTDWVLDAALSHIAAWNAEGVRLQISINISASNLDEEDFSERVLRRVQRSGTPPGSMELEVTESALIRNGDRPLAHLNVLRSAGVNIAVDDFGTGYSSLAYLKRIPAHIVKIDRSFVQEMERAEKDLLLVTSMIGMLQGLGFRVVAEGIETAEAYRLLAKAGCDEAQGYYLAKPLEFAAFENWLSEAQKARA